MTDAVKVQWPAKAFSEEGGDPTPALTSLLRSLRLLPEPNAKVEKLKTPQSLQVLTAGSTSITNLYTALTTVVGGGGALAAAIVAFWNNFEGSESDKALQHAVFMGSAAFLGSAVVIAVSIMVRGDVAGRAQAHAAAYAARAETSAAFLRALEAALPKPAESPAPYYVAKGKLWLPVVEFDWEDNGVVAVTEKDRIPSNEWRGLLRTNDLGKDSNGDDPSA